VVVLLVLPVLLVVAGRGGALSEPPLSRGLAKQVGGKEEEEQLLLGKVGAELVLVASDHNTLHPPPLQQQQHQQQLWGSIPSLGALYLPVHSVRREAAKVLRVCGGESPRQRPDPLPPGVDILALLLVRPRTFNTPLAGWVIVGLC
jgi:hypothetical protein